jgi:hypothetical protein
MNSPWFDCASSVALALRGSSLRLAVLCLFLLGFSFHAFGQEATIVGTVTDPSGSVVTKAAITVINTDTGQTRNTVTNDTGQYVAPDLVIGHYTIRVQAPGFKGIERKDVVLAVGDRTRMDFKLELGSAQQTVTVEATTVAVQTESGEISTAITGQQVRQLATNGRSIYTLVNLSPGTASLQADFQTPTPVGGDANVSFNGNRPGHNLYLLDGGENQDRGGAGTFSVMPSIDAIAEFRALTSSYSAEYGLSSAGTMTTVLKSGTKQFHASAWEFLRNDALDARNYFNPAPNKVAELRFNTYGFNVGGQVPLWKSHPTFFFYNMEWRSLIQGGLTNQTVPLVSTYGGQFASSLAVTALHTPCTNQVSSAIAAQYAAAGQTLSTPDPTSGACSTSNGAQAILKSFTNNAIPTSLLNANAQALLKAGIFPAPTSGAQFIGGNNSPTNVREELARIDHQFSDKFSIFGHWISEQISQGYGTTQWSGDNVPTVGDTFGNPSYSAVVHTTYVISPTLLNEAAFNYNGNRINIIPNGVVAAPSDFGFNRVFTGPNALTRIPSIQLSGNTGTNYTSNWTPWVNTANDYQIRDDVSWTKGAHQLKFGGSWALYKKVQNLFTNTQGGFGFNGGYTGDDFADFLLGYANSYSEDAVQDSGHWNNVSWAAYIQDNWRATRRLTLNLGLRWDGVPHTYEANNRASNFYPNLYNPANAPIFLADGTISPASPGLGPSPNPILAGYQFYLNGVGIAGHNGISNGLVQNYWGAFGPRLGFAYDLTGRGTSVLRGGFGTMYERIQGNDMYNAGPNVPFSANASFNSVSLSNPKTSVQTGTTINPLALPIVVTSLKGLNSTEYKLPVSYQFNLGIQQALGEKSVLSIAYVGNQNRHQSQYIETNLPPVSQLAAITAGTNTTPYNQLLPNLGFRSIDQAENVANASYNSLQVDLHATVRNDLNLQFGYTYSRAIDPVAGNQNSYDLNSVSNPYAGAKYDYGPSFFDRTHVAFVNFVYQIPLLKNSQSRFLKTAFGGWELSGIVLMETGAPLNITMGGNNVCSVLAGPFSDCTNRPEITGPISYPKKVNEWFDPSVLSAPALGTWGDLGHNAIRGPGRDNWNLSLFKSFVISESRGSRFEFRAESFNTWNHTQFIGNEQQGGISSTFGASNFGAVTSAYDPRVFQLGAKLIF